MARPREAYEDTRVPWYKSRGEIEDMIRRETGALGISWTEVHDHEVAPKGGSLVVLRFMCPQKLPAGGQVTIGIRIGVPIPGAPTAKERTQKVNQRHRSLYWWLKAQFDAVASGLITFSEEFFPHIDTGAGTVFERVAPQLIQGLAAGQMRPLALLPPGMEVQQP